MPFTSSPDPSPSQNPLSLMMSQMSKYAMPSSTPLYHNAIKTIATSDDELLPDRPMLPPGSMSGIHFWRWACEGSDCLVAASGPEAAGGGGIRNSDLLMAAMSHSLNFPLFVTACALPCPLPRLSISFWLGWKDMSWSGLRNLSSTRPGSFYPCRCIIFTHVDVMGPIFHGLWSFLRSRMCRQRSAA